AHANCATASTPSALAKLRFSYTRWRRRWWWRRFTLTTLRLKPNHLKFFHTQTRTLIGEVREGERVVSTGDRSVPPPNTHLR
uniref:PH domain-containing protein n=1 Tax=Mesocestoides corti TaxID=53468 RepID=A0A5K3FNC2_MESCO